MAVTCKIQTFGFHSAFFRQQENLSGIFNWLIEGYRLLKAEGLTVPDRVLQATKEYRQETNIVGELRRRYDICRDGARGNEIVDVDFIPNDAPWRDGY